MYSVGITYVRFELCLGFVYVVCMLWYLNLLCLVLVCWCLDFGLVVVGFVY